MPPGNFEILHALKCILGAPEAPSHACIYISASYCLQLVVSDQKVQRMGPQLADCTVVT